MALKVGDLVACYVTNTSEYETLMSWGVVIDVNEAVEDVLVVDNYGSSRWWPSKRWKILSKKPQKTLDLQAKVV
mgnify:CR=1 FL=1